MKLRAPEPSDIDFIYMCENHPDRLLHGRTGLFLSRDQLRLYIKNYHERSLASGHIRFIVDNFDMQAGIADLYDIDNSSRRAFISVYIDEPFRRQGLGTRVLGELCEFGRDELGLFQLCATISTENAPSLALFMKCGFKEIARLPQWVRSHDGTLKDALLTVKKFSY